MDRWDWEDQGRRCFGALFGGDVGDRFVSLQGYPEVDDSFLLILNAHAENVEFVVPSVAAVRRWDMLVDTARPNALLNVPVAPDSRLAIAGRSFSLFAGRLSE